MKSKKDKSLAASVPAGAESALRGDSRHTPAPWKIRIAGTLSGRGPEVYREGEHYDDGSEFVIADCGCSEATGGQSGRWRRTSDAEVIDANARLIAAAPELLEALKEVPAWFEEWNVEIGAAEETLLDRVNAAIATAEGSVSTRTSHPESAAQPPFKPKGNS